MQTSSTRRQAHQQPPTRPPLSASGYGPATLTRLTGLRTSPGFATEYMHAFLATDLTPTQQHLDETEHIQVHPTPLPHALQMIHDGRLTDAKSIATLLGWERFGELQR